MTMCAPDHGKMDDASLYRIGSPSPTLVESDHGQSSPVDSFWKAKEHILGPSPVVQTVDCTPWIRLDALHPKLLQELRRGYDIPDYDNKRPRTKGAAKIKAWVRQNSIGVVLRYRRKIDENQDEVIDAEIVEEKMQIPGTTVELPSDNAILEAPGDTDNFVREMSNSATPEAWTARIVNELQGNQISELPASTTRRESWSSDRAFSVDPLPRYESTEGNTSHSCVRKENDDKNDRSTEALATAIWSDPGLLTGPLPAEAPVISPIDPALDHGNLVANSRPASGVSDNSSQAMAMLEANLDETKQQLRQEKEQKEEIESLVTTLRQRLSEQSNQQARMDNLLKGFKIVTRTRYETETDAEPPSPISTSKARSLRLKTSFSSLARRKQSANTKAKRGQAGISSTEDEDSDYAPKSKGSPLQRRTGPRKTPISAGKEAILSALLQAQIEILGSKDPWTRRAKRKAPSTFNDWQQDRMTQLVKIFRKTENLAKGLLGVRHVRVKTFSDDLRTFEDLLGRVFCASMDELIDQMGDQVSSQSSSPVTPVLKNEDEQALITKPPVPREANENTHVKDHLELKVGVPQIVEPCSDKPSAANGESFNFFPRPYQPRTPTTIFTGLVIAAITGVMMRVLQWIQRNFGAEPPVEIGKARVRWTCSCGEELYDDYVEHEPGAARRLEDLLNRPRVRTRNGDSPTPSPITPSSGGSYDTRSPSDTINYGASSHSSWSSIPGNNQFTEKRQNTYSSGATTIIPQFLSSFGERPDPPYLLACTSEDKYTTKMTHIDVARDHITSDMKLAYALREHYSNVNRRWWRGLRLRGLSAIEFVQFEVHYNRFADIRKCPDIPPPVAPHASDYDFVADTMPPIGSKLLLHLFRHPEDYDRELMAYLRIPKRTAGRLQHGVGWGLNLVEDFLAERVAIMIGSLVFFTSIVFAVAWVCKKNDIQGAFAVAQWISSGAVFACGWVQLYVG